jgi:tRNA pseudouridine38-40 synthase
MQQAQGCIEAGFFSGVKRKSIVLQRKSATMMSDMPLHRYFIRLSYDGSPFLGWQRQAGDAPTVQQAIEDVLAMLLKQPVEVTGAGRTDTGVHARCYYAHFDSSLTPKEMLRRQLPYKLNKILPHEIAISDIIPVQEDAHARFSALSRTYQYLISTQKDPFLHQRAWLFERRLDISAMQHAANLLLNIEDFACFSKSNTQVKTTLCQVSKAKWTQQGPLLVFEISANRFLRNMVRAVVGTLVDIGLQKINLEDFQGILDSRDRRKAGYSVPGYGLYLTGIEYPPDIWLQE